jgi:hypothetical protein
LTRFSSTCATLTCGGGADWALPPDFPHPPIDNRAQAEITHAFMVRILDTSSLPDYDAAASPMGFHHKTPMDGAYIRLNSIRY